MARDRDLPPDLIAELETVSRYNADTKGGLPLILRHRIVSLRSGTYHILSRIHDAGTDYSKRNNHIAHHLVFHESETIGLPNPAAILLNWRGWRTKWDEPPRILEAFEAFDLQDIESFWATQNLPNHFRSVIKSGVAHSCVFNISLQEERKLIEHLRRTINDLPTSQRWAHTFTSCLLPTDQPQDYAWSGRLPHIQLRYEVDSHPSPLPTPANTAEAPPPAPQPEPTEREEEASEPKFKAPVVEIPAEYDPRNRKRPKRHFGSRELSRTINWAIVGGGLICLALLLFFVQSHKNSSLLQPEFEPAVLAEKYIQAREKVWQAYAEAGYPRAELEAVRPAAAFLANSGQDNPSQIIDFLDQLLTANPAHLETGISVPPHLIEAEDDLQTLPLSPIGYPVISQIALLPRSLLPRLTSIPDTAAAPGPLAAMPHSSFSPSLFSDALDTYIASANTPYDSIPPATRTAIETYLRQKQTVLTNVQFTPIQTLYQVFGLDSSTAYIAFDETQLLIASTPLSLAQYLREVFLEHVRSSNDQALQSTVFLAFLDRIRSETFATSLETASIIYQALEELDLETRGPSDDWRRIRDQWRRTFVREDLMEQTILGYTLDALEHAKLQLAEARSQFGKDDLQLHLLREDREASVQDLKQAAIEAVGSKEWIVISKQPTKAHTSSQ